jgi:hypothetical protein
VVKRAGLTSGRPVQPVSIFNLLCFNDRNAGQSVDRERNAFPGRLHFNEAVFSRRSENETVIRFAKTEKPSGGSRSGELKEYAPSRLHR